MLIHGKCHCGNISLALEWKPEPAAIPARACDCSFCSKHGGVWTSCPGGALRVVVKDPAQVSNYAFGTGTAMFRVCRGCGVVPVVTSELDGRLYAVVSVNALELPPSLPVERAPASFEGETLEARLARRRRSWIGDVRYVPEE